MKKLLLVIGVLACAAAPAFAQDGSLYYAWDNCFGDTGANGTVTFDCAGNGIAASYGSFQLTNAASNVVAVSGVLDLSVNGQSSLPPFWHMEAGGCNAGGVSIDDARGGVCSGANPIFQGSTGQNTDAFVTAYGAGFGGDNKARVLWSVNRASSNPVNFNAATRYFAFKMNWITDNAVEAGLGGTCTGCGAVASMALNTILLESPFQGGGEATAGIISSTDPGSQPSTCANAATCESVPTKARTWGQLKALYR